MKHQNMNSVPQLSALAAISLLAGLSLSASAANYSIDEIDIRWDNSLSHGVAWRLEDPDADQIMPANGEATGQEATGSSYNYDDGTLNYKKGDKYTNVVKWVSDLEISWQNYGGFFRARAWFDKIIMDHDPRFKDYSQETKDAAGKGAELMDAYVWGDFDVAEVPVSARLGRQVVNWGESTFIQGGINSINPVDAAAFRRPGAEIKEGLLPVNMLYVSAGLTDSLSLEGFYQLEWQKTRSDPCGTFFSTADFIADGCGPVILAGTIDERVVIENRDQEIAEGTPLSERVWPVTERLEDDTPADSGQYGLALRWYAESLGDTEFGFYYMNIHSRLPYINGVVSNIGDDGLINTDGQYQNAYPLYQIAYPEDLTLAGISFATSTSGGSTLSGEISYRPDAPLQWNAFELLLAGSAAPYSRLYQQRLAENGGDEEALRGNLAQGYDEFDIWQAQTSFISFLDPMLGADRIALVTEIGLNYIPDLPDVDEARYGRSGAYGIGNNDGVWAVAGDTNFCTADTNPLTGDPNSGKNANTDNCTDEGYVTRWSGGVRARVAANFNNAFAGLNVTPTLSVAYDQGYGPEPGSQFIDERLTTGLGVSFLYQYKTSVDITYTNYSGGEYNQLKDRDNLAFSAKYSF